MSWGCLRLYNLLFQAFINTAKEIYEKIQEGVFDINNEVSLESCKYIYRKWMNHNNHIYLLHWIAFCTRFGVQQTENIQRSYYSIQYSFI